MPWQGVLRKIPIQEIYHYIRSVFQTLNQDLPLTIDVLQISKNTLYHALHNLDPKPLVYDKKLKDEHLVYIHSRSITNPMISGQALADEIKQLFQLNVTGRTINRYSNEIGQKYRPPIRSVVISPKAAQKRYNFTKFLLEAKKDFKNVVFTDESWFELGKNSK